MKTREKPCIEQSQGHTKNGNFSAGPYNFYYSKKRGDNESIYFKGELQQELLLSDIHAS